MRSSPRGTFVTAIMSAFVFCCTLVVGAHAGEFPDHVQNETQAFAVAVTMLGRLDSTWSTDNVVQTLERLGFDHFRYVGKAAAVQVEFGMIGPEITVEYKPLVATPLASGILASVSAHAKRVLLIGADTMQYEVDGLTFPSDEEAAAKWPRSKPKCTVRREIVVSMPAGRWVCTRAVLSWAKASSPSGP